MRITILANRDIASNFAVNQLLAALSAHQVTLFLSAKVGAKSERARGLAQLQFFEQGIFNELLFPLLDKSTGNNKYKSFEQLSGHLQAPVIELNCINTDKELAQFRASAPDLVISIRYGVILREEAISIPKLGIINLHSGLLPDYRGVMASFWALLNEEQELGTTLHYIDSAEIDTGGILSRSSIPVMPERSYLWHVLELYVGGCQLIIQHIKNIENGTAVASQQQDTSGAYYSFPSKEDLERFEGKGLVLYRGSDIINLVKAFYI